MKIISFNVNGIQQILKKHFDDNKKINVLHHLIATENPDFLCLQEIRCSSKFQWSPPKKGNFFESKTEYHTFTFHSEHGKGYSGTLVCSKIKPLNVTYGVPNIVEREGRVITLEFEKFYIVNV